MAKPQVAVAPVVVSKLSVKAPEFYPSGYNMNFTQNFVVSIYLSFLVYFNLLIFNLTFFFSRYYLRNSKDSDNNL